MKDAIPLENGLLLCAMLSLAGCGPTPDYPMSLKQYRNAPEVPVRDERRVDITRIGVFEDGTAYNSRRGIYIIKDNKTGIEYIGISGIGISETGSHQTGKTQTQDER